MQHWTHRVVDRFLWGQCCLFLLPLLTVYLHPALLGNVRNGQILLLLLVLGVLWKRGARGEDLLAFTWSQRSWRIFAGVSLCSFIATGLTHLWGLKLNGEDFSIFDWMLFNTNHRQFMTSPICNMADALGVCHHFGIHPTYIMIPLAWLHRLFEAPHGLILIHSVALWSAIFPLKRLASAYLRHDILVLAVVLAFLSNGYVGSILNHGFHVEVFFIPFGLWMLLAWEEKSVWVYGFLLLFLAVKEDAAFYTSSFAIFQIIKNSRDFRRCGIFLGISLLVLGLNLLVVQPYFLQVGQAEEPSYLRFWGHLGHSKGEIIHSILGSPWQSLTMILGSHWWVLFGSLLFIPLLSLPALSAMAPALVIYGLSNISNMREYATYYSAPLIPFLFFGWVDGGRMLWRSSLPQNRVLGILTTACLLFSVTGGGYQKFPPIAFAVLHDLAEARQLLKEQDPQLLCAQTLLFPHLPYEWRIQPLSVECMSQTQALTIFLNNERYNAYPLGAKELLATAQQVPATRLIRSYPSGLQIYRHD